MNLKTLTRDQVATHIVKNGGGTFEYTPRGQYRVVDGTEPNGRGRPRVWAVAINHPRNVKTALPVSLTDQTLFIARQLAWWVPRMNYRVYYIGAWIDAGMLYLEHAVTLADRRDAIGRAELYNQRSIYNLATGETVWLKGEES
jgi:hypothetical protein